MKALRGTGVEPPVVLLFGLPLPELLPLLPVVAVLRELEPEALALSEAAEPPVDPDSTLVPAVLVEADERAEVELVPAKEEVVLVLPARFSTEGVAFRDEPLPLELGVSNELPEEAVVPAPAPEEEPAVFEATAVTEPVCEDWMYRSCRLPGLR
jgi:hypothetical protein